MCMVSGTAFAARSSFSPECRMMGIRSLMQQSTFPCFIGVTATSAGKAYAKGMLSSKMFVFGICARCGLCVLDGSQSALARMLLARSVIISDMEHQRGGHGEPPKVSLRDMQARSLWHVQLAADVWRPFFICLYAAEKSNLSMRIGVPRKWKQRL